MTDRTIRAARRRSAVAQAWHAGALRPAAADGLRAASTGDL